MAYTIPQIIGWMAISQPFARIGEAKKQASNSGSSVDEDLDIKLYNTRRDIEYQYAQDPTSDILYSIGNYGLALCGIYLFAAQQATGGGAVTPINPVTPVSPTISVLPLYLKSSDFTDSTHYDNPDIVGLNLALYVNELGPKTLYMPDGISATSTGIVVNDPAFNALVFDFTMTLYKVNIP